MKKLVFLIISIIIILLNVIPQNNKVGIIDGVLRKNTIEKYCIEDYISYTTLKEEDSSLHGEEVLKIILEKNNSKVYFNSVEEQEYNVSIENVDIINLSIAFLENDSRLEKAIKKCQEKGIVIVAAVDNIDIESYPAAYENVIAVASKDSEMNYDFLVKTDKYDCNSYNTASVTNFIIKNNLQNKKISKIYDCIQEDF